MFSATSCAQQNTRPPSYYHNIGKEPLVYRTIGQQLARAATMYPNREAIVSCHQKKRYTFAETLEKVETKTLLHVHIKRF